MKNSIQLSTILLVIISSFFFGNQINAQSVKLQDFDSSKNRVYVSPFIALNPYGRSVEITYGRVLDNKNEVQISYSKRMKDAELIFVAETDIENADNWITYLFGGTRARVQNGFRVGLEHQFHQTSTDKISTYYGVELFYAKDQIEFYQSTFFIFGHFTDYQLKRNKIGANFKKVSKIHLTKNLIIEAHYGIGLKYVHFDYTNHENDFRVYDLNDNTGLWKVNFPINIKVGYSL